MTGSVKTLFNSSVKRFNKRPAIQYFCKKREKWVMENWSQLNKRVMAFAKALYGSGVQSGDRVGLLSLTRPEWVVGDMAILQIGAVTVPIYHSSLVDQIAYILADSQTKTILVENEEQLLKVRSAQEQIGSLKQIILFDCISGPLKENECLLEDFVAKYENEPDPNVEVKGDSLASLVYTSGTTGEPKGAMISHDNFLYEAQVIEKTGILSNDDIQLLFLPLAHIFARVLQMSWVKTGHLLAFAESIEKVVDNMAVIRPTFMAGVPRVYEKVRAKIIEQALSSGGLKKSIAQFAFKEAENLDDRSFVKSAKLFAAKKLVFDKVAKKLDEKFGGRLRFLISGGAKLAQEVSSFFQLSGVILCEGYGLTETTAATCLNLPWALRHGTVGRPMPGTDVQLAEDGEICVRGRGVFLGFWNKPEETKKVLSEDGWFKTGDIGEIDRDGFVKIVDRKKDIIVTAQGKNVAPQRVENLIKSKSPVIAHVVVIGDKKPYLTALIALDKANAISLAHPDRQGNGVSLLELSSHQEIYAEVKNAIASANEMLARFEQIKRFQILGSEFEIGKELTPTLKVKRRACADKFQREINVLYT